jgi:two-component system nitrate/nitrite sensor histidine kinase NarX
MLGSQVLWAAVPDAFTRRRALLMAIVAAQAALLIENHRLYLRGEHEAAIAERARLAREIHDGLAQTLAYLKLRTAQIGNRLRAGDQGYAVAGLDAVRQLLDEAYIDTREAIDGLLLIQSESGIQAWVKQIVAEFERLSHIPVEITFPSNLTLAVEVQAQLQRIVQETFSNIRKHADATRVWLQADIEDQMLILQISDNGRGFDPDDVAPIARHGLRIMAERAELIDADLRISSRLDGGTHVAIRLPAVCPVSEV